MTRQRNLPVKDFVDSSLTVATFEDVLFKPLELGGEEFLQIRRLKLKQQKRRWNAARPQTYEVDTEKDKIYLRSLEPTEWKDQDHYAVIGLKHLRHRASEEDIKKAYRQRALRHHPDKRMGNGEVVIPEGDYFACIVKAFETLSNPARKRAYDSVDPCFDNFVPSKSLSAGDNFFTVYGRWFELNSRWSNRLPVPFLGNMSTPRVKVDQFYAFWYDFDSWREYSYLDEEDKEKGQHREERRWIDKQNKTTRAKLKKEEMTRIRSAVDSAYSLDPRITIFKEQDLQTKIDKKMERQKAVKEKLDLEAKLRQDSIEKARIEREKQEREDKEKQMVAKKEKEIAKKALKKVRKDLRTMCKSKNYYGTDDKTAVNNMTDMETLCNVLSVNELEELNQKLSSLNIREATTVFLQKSKEVTSKLAAEKVETVKVGVSLSSSSRSEMEMNNVVANGGQEDWSTDELILLIKAVNVYPAGTVQRWEVVANFLQQHGTDKRKRCPKEVLAKAKDLKASDFSKSTLKEDVNQQAFAVFEKNSNFSVRVEAPETTREPESTVEVKSAQKSSSSETDVSNQEVKAWTAEEQKLLEQALKTFPSSHSDRWERIAECVPDRNKKECIARFKELATVIKAKKSAHKL